MPAEPRLAREILSYFLRNSEAADDLQGIAGWRLLEQAIYHRVEDTARALDWLVAEGFLREEGTIASGTVFRLERSSRNRAEDFLEDEKTSEES